MSVEAIPLSASLPRAMQLDATLPWATRGAPPVKPTIAVPDLDPPPPQIFSTAPTTPKPALKGVAAQDIAANVVPYTLPKVSLAFAPVRAAETYKSFSLSGIAQQVRELAAPLMFGEPSAGLAARQILSEANALDRIQITKKSLALTEQESILEYDINNAFQAESTRGHVISNTDPELSIALRRLKNGVEGLLGVA